MFGSGISSHAAKAIASIMLTVSLTASALKQELPAWPITGQPCNVQLVYDVSACS
jgi:hypothetical protein